MAQMNNALPALNAKEDKHNVFSATELEKQDESEMEIDEKEEEVKPTHEANPSIPKR